jgi:hypothetical protein
MALVIVSFFFFNIYRENSRAFNIIFYIYSDYNFTCIERKKEKKEKRERERNVLLIL